MFAEDCPPLPWDAENKYTREAIELYYEVSIKGVMLHRNTLFLIIHQIEHTLRVSQFYLFY